MSSFDLNKIVRPNVLAMEPYSCARDEFEGEAAVFLDANENSLGSLAGDGYNRYPDPRQTQLRVKVAKIKGVKPEQVFFGNGSDEPIDLLFRAFCRPTIDRAIINPPTYGMYKVQAAINETPIDEILLTPDFQLQTDMILAAVTPNTKLIFVCSPNNPSGNLMKRADIVRLIESFNGIVVVDEAYIDFAETESFTQLIDRYPNLIVLQTFSKAWGMAALRCGMAFAQKAVIDVLLKIKYPYNINILTQETVFKALDREAEKNAMVKQILANRAELIRRLNACKCVECTYPTNANFVLAKVSDAPAIYRFLVSRGIIVRSRHNVALCTNGLRITVGKAGEDDTLINALNEFGKTL
jgi:histidinol-phosphate aminotransferase